MRSFVVTLGFHEDHVVRLLTSSGATRDDRVFVLTAKPAVPAVFRAFEGLRAYTLRAGIGEPRLVEVPPDLVSGVEAVLEVFRGGGEYVLELSGGMRYLLIYTLIALLMSGREAQIHIYPEGGAAPEITIPRAVIGTLRKPPTEAELAVLREVAKSPGITDEEIAQVLNKKVKTVKNTLTALTRKGLAVRRGRRGGIYPTKWGELIAKYLFSP